MSIRWLQWKNEVLFAGGLVAFGGCLAQEPENSSAMGASEGPTELDDEAECNNATAYIECEHPMSVRSITGEDVADYRVHSLEEKGIVLEGGVFLPPDASAQLVGEAVVDNDYCVIGCFVELPPNLGACLGIVDDGSVSCQSPSLTEQDCMALLEVCPN